MMPLQFEFPYLGENKKLNDPSRAELPGDFFQCEDGFTHYQLEGEKDGPMVVLVHGFSTPSFIWDPTFDALLSQGFRVLRYDLFGRGFSDRPNLPNNKELFDRQLSELLVGLEIKEKIILVGLSMGGIISASFAAKNVDNVSKLVLIDPAGVVPIKMPRIIKIGLFPFIGETIFNLVGNKRIEKIILRDFDSIENISDVLEKIQMQMPYKGYKRSLLSTARSGLLTAEEPAYRIIGKSDLPVLLIWGEEDNIVAFEHHKKLQSLIPQIDFHPIADSGHIPHYDSPEIVNPILVEFLNRK